jgi:hypothetical protein
MHLLNIDEGAEFPGVTIINNPPSSGQISENRGSTVNTEPDPPPSNPLNYLLIAAVGITFGIALTPLAETWYRRFVNRGRGEA